MKRSKSGAKATPAAPTTTANSKPTAMACTAPTAAPSGSFSPMRRATYAVVAMLSPSEIPNTTTSSDSVKATVASESTPSRATKNISTTPNSDSISISRIIGIASTTIERRRLPSVKSRPDPASASRISPNALLTPIIPLARLHLHPRPVFFVLSGV